MILRGAIVSEQRRTIGGPPRALAAQAAREQLESPAQATLDGTAPIESEVKATAAADSAASPRDSRLTFELVAAWLAVQDGETRTACASILADEIAQVHESARTEGFALGQVQGREQAQQAAQSAVAALQALTDRAEAAFAEEQVRLGEACAEIVAESFTKLAGAALIKREAAVAAVTQVLSRVKEGRELAIRVSAIDLPILQQEQARLATAMPGRKFSLFADPRVELGGCIVDSGLGSLDGRIELQLAELYETLRAARSSPAERT